MYRKMLVLRFSAETTGEPIVCNLSRDFNLCFNILRAQIVPGEEGIMVLEISGNKRDVIRGLSYLRAKSVTIKPVEREIRKNNDICIQCGACTGICPTKALSINRQTMEVLFDPKLCTACEMCVSICPVKAMEIRFSKELMPYL